MAKKDELPQDLTDRIAREENQADRELVTKPARAVMDAARKIGDTLTGKGAKDFEPKRFDKSTGYVDTEGNEITYKSPATDAVRTPVGGPGAEMRSLNMGKKSGAYKTSDFKKGGKVSSASKRADGCCIRGKTRA
jgi:hypothetical protein